MKKLEYWIDRALVTFARDSLKPTAFATASMARLQQLLEKKLPPERAKLAVGELSLGIHPDPDADLPQAMPIPTATSMRTVIVRWPIATATM